MAADYFQRSKRRLSDIVGRDLEVMLMRSPRSTTGDIGTVAELEELSDAGETYKDVDTGTTERRFATEQTTVEIANDDGEYYAKVIVHFLQDYNVALIEWVEVVDDRCRGHGIGRMLHEEVVEYIDAELGARVTYTKLENTRMQGPVLDSGFRQVEAATTEPWYKRD